MKSTIAWRAVAQAFPCEVCGAGPGDKCTTSGGAVTFTPHAPRTNLAHAAGWVHPDEAA